MSILLNLYYYTSRVFQPPVHLVAFHWTKTFTGRKNPTCSFASEAACKESSRKSVWLLVWVVSFAVLNKTLVISRDKGFCKPLYKHRCPEKLETIVDLFHYCQVTIKFDQIHCCTETRQLCKDQCLHDPVVWSELSIWKLGLVSDSPRWKEPWTILQFDNAGIRPIDKFCCLKICHSLW